jgi:hypothetical protein
MKNFARYSLLALAVLALSASSFAGVFVSVTVAPPVLPVYAQPPCPGDGYIWTPGYWAWGPDGYYWVPGTWVVAPAPGLLWTPGYWGWGEGVYVWHPGYWGPHVGFYGGVNYGFGYFGVGFGGGYWRGDRFFYNRSVTNINVTNVHITNVYNQTVINNNVNVTRVSYNGGEGGIHARPRPEEEEAFRERRFESTRMQANHEHAARENREFLASVNHGRPAIAATARPGEFHGRDVMPARNEGNFRPDNRGGNRGMDNRGMDNRAVNHGVPRPQDSGRNMDRPMPHQDSYNRGGQNPRQDAYGNRGGRPENNAPRPDNRMENRGGSAPHPTAYHPESGGGHQQAPRGEQAHGQPDHGHEHGR